MQVCKGTEKEQRGLINWDRWQTRLTFWKRMKKRIEEREAEEERRRRLEKGAQKQHECKAEMLGAAVDHLEEGPADEQPGATATQVHGEDEGGVPPQWDPPEPDPYCR